MAFTLNEFIGLRPTLFHTTTVDNVPRLRVTGRLESAASLMERAGRQDLLRKRRVCPIKINVEGELVTLCDQKPLVAGNIEFQAGWTLDDLVESLNRRVYFWPGDNERPAGSYGRNHFNALNNRGVRVLRIALQSLLSVNPGIEPEFCPFNSGAPRMNQGKPGPRGPRTFLSAGQFERTPGKVKEVTFNMRVSLPRDTEIAPAYQGPWERLFA